MISFYGDPSIVSAEQVATFKQGFIDAYNVLGATCGILFRKMAYVSLEVMMVRGYETPGKYILWLK